MVSNRERGVFPELHLKLIEKESQRERGVPITAPERERERERGERESH